MWRTAEEIEADVRSGERDRLTAALESLEFLHDTMDPVPLAPLRAADLAPFGDELPDDEEKRWVTLITKYENWQPPLSTSETAIELARAAARFGPTGLGLRASMYLKTGDDPLALTQAALAALVRKNTIVKPEHAGPFVSYLLAGNDVVRGATVDALAAWKKQGALPEVIDFVEAELSADERTRVGLP